MCDLRQGAGGAGQGVDGPGGKQRDGGQGEEPAQRGGPGRRDQAFPQAQRRPAHQGEHEGGLWARAEGGRVTERLRATRGYSRMRVHTGQVWGGVRGSLTVHTAGVKYFQHSLKTGSGLWPVMSLMLPLKRSAPAGKTRTASPRLVWWATGLLTY